MSSLVENQVKMAIQFCKCSHLTSGWVRVAAQLAKSSLPITKIPYYLCEADEAFT